jgi:hypothetical protein
MAKRSDKKERHGFEVWRDRLFSVLVPFFFGYIFLSQANNNNTIKIVILVLLLGFATGEAAIIGRHILLLLGRLTGVEEDNPRKTAKKENNDNHEQRNQEEA